MAGMDFTTLRGDGRPLIMGILNVTPDSFSDGGRYRTVADACAHAEGMLADGAFSPDDRYRFRPLVDDLLGHDHFLVTADFADYFATQRVVDRAFGARESWLRKAILNTARVGWFSSDRAIRGYARDIWHALPPEEGVDAPRRQAG